jgi:imidazolonepropionase-like amidohydrolase
MASREVRLVPTLSTMVNIARRGQEWQLPQEWSTIAESILEVHRDSFRNALEAGVRCGTGTDGYGDMVDEIIEFTSYGLSPMRAIQAATRDSAQIVVPGSRFGVLDEGWTADVIAVAGDPLSDLAALRDVSFVLQAGRPISLDPSEG